MNSFDVLHASRTNFLRLIEGFTTEQLTTIPKGFSNTIAWNLGHLLVTQQLLTYGLSGNKFLISNELVEKYRKGTKPDADVDEAEIKLLKEQFLTCIEGTKKDFENGLFAQFTSYPTSFGVTLNSIEDALEFTNVHEALHLGIVMAMRKLV
jgi:hypothetical protein